MIGEEAQPTPRATPEAEEFPAQGPKTRAAPVERWIAEHGDVLWGFVLGRTRSREAAEDVIQETILAAMRAHEAYAGESSERTWLLGIAAHKVADHFRAAHRRASGRGPGRSEPPDDESASSGTMFTPRGMWATPPGVWGLDAGRTAENQELVAALRRCIESLPPSQAEAIWLRDLLNVPGPEVCKAMGITPTNLWSRLHRARSALRCCVEKSLGMSSKDKA